ncbi:MAG: 16S rRNA (cytidine(1402)-2'-O)-methyltransferase [Candidatus Calescibacterium sp.]|nr:16S rRNA (cytidine(1402)-2'-O)-methyltransferase [Candidatus Calescibacterium sp.]MCX7733716.1 16S rRNA (cytidine(1402)-2'-O)-methyltransferase [bacterium]MDW8087500.1 16S rRNA (cytidine(1402)-2'-O)-methyltransferase [Candidatus Calescibacterium sp.]
MALFVVGTPIGNLKDITERAKEIIMKSQIFICEQREYAMKLLNYLGAKPKKILTISKEENLPETVLEELKNTDGVLVVSAGTPAISDPGSRIVKICAEKGVNVVPIPGVSAVTTALSVCGFDTSRFIFLGFIPKKGRKNFLMKIKRGMELLPFSPILVIYESPHRVISTLQDIADVFGEQSQVFLAREMTKMFEEFIRGKITDVMEELIRRKEQKGSIKGEITIVVSFRDADSFDQPKPQVENQ